MRKSSTRIRTVEHNSFVIIWHENGSANRDGGKLKLEDTYRAGSGTRIFDKTGSGIAGSGSNTGYEPTQSKSG